MFSHLRLSTRVASLRRPLGDLSTPSLAVEKLLDPKATEAERVQALGKLTRIAEDKDRALSLLHSGAVPPLLALLPSAAAVRGPGDIAMPLVGLCVEVLERQYSASRYEDEGRVPERAAAGLDELRQLADRVSCEEAEEGRL